jgi:hypothetical protein
MKYEIFSFDEKPELFYKIDEIVPTVWPEFMLQSEIADAWWAKLFEWFPQYQVIAVENGEVVGGANCLPLSWNKPFNELPDEGWDWMMEYGCRGYENGDEPNTVSGIQIIVKKDRQGEGWSTKILEAVKVRVKAAGFQSLIIPIRPSQKHRYPLITMDDYAMWTREDGQPFDPWIRIHKRAGGTIESVCHKAMDIRGTAGQWKAWTGIEMKQKGEYVIPFALNPVSYDPETDSGVYIEPNIWISYEL